MRQYEDFERQQMEILKQHKKEEIECVFCPKCRSRWFEEVAIHQYTANHHVILGQQVPKKPGSVSYYVLKCVRCGDLLEPNIIHNTRDIGGNDYDGLLDTLEGKNDTREKEEDPTEALKLAVKGLQERIDLLEQTKASKPDKKGSKKKEAAVSPNLHIKRKKLEVPSEDV